MASLAGLHPVVRERLQAAIETAHDDGIRVTVTSTRRDSKKQAALYAAWLARGKTGLPAAPPGHSTHEFGLGVDLVVTRGDLRTFVRIAECAGLKWAGPVDPVHFDPFGFDAWRRFIQTGKPGPVEYAC